MTSNALRFNQDRIGNVNPISQLGRVITNGYLNKKYIRKCKKNRRPFYAGDRTDEAYYAYQGEIAVTTIGTVTPRQNRNEDATSCFTVLNGAFDKDDDQISTDPAYINDQLVFAGIIQNPVIKYSDSDGGNLALNIGGLNTILNTSQETIHAGDQVYWSVPDPERYANTNEPVRTLLETRPYKPDLQKLTKKGLCTMWRSRSDLKSKRTFPTAILDASKNLHKYAMGAFITNLHAAASAGIITINEDALTDHQVRQGYANTYRRSINTKNVLYELSKEIGAIDSSYLSEAVEMNEEDKIVINNGLEGNTPRSLEDTIRDSIIGEDDMLICNLTTSKKIPDGIDGELVRIQLNSLENMFSFVNAANEHTTRRIFGQAKSKAEPGKSFDIQLARNHAI